MNHTNPSSSKRFSSTVALRVFLMILPLAIFSALPFIKGSPLNLQAKITKHNHSIQKRTLTLFILQSPEFVNLESTSRDGGVLINLLFRNLFEIAEHTRKLDELEKYRTLTSLQYANPEDVGMNPMVLSYIDSIVADAINRGAMPGAQVFVARNGMIIYEKAFGFHDYTQSRPVELTDLYDVASVTKIAATTLAAMKLASTGKLDINATFGSYFTDTISRVPEGEKSIFSVPIRNMLVHQSGMQPSLPVGPYIRYADSYNRMMKKIYHDNLLAMARLENHMETLPDQGSLFLKDINEVDPDPTPQLVFDFSPEEAFDYFFSRSHDAMQAPNQVAKNMFLRSHFTDSILNAVKQSRISPEPKFHYSCLNMILLQMLMDSINHSNLDAWLKDEFYQSLGMMNTTFNPLNHFPDSRIPPTEIDTVWRKQLIHGTVHDPSAALLGGIAGNAGLFSTASDLGILGQMLLNGGIYSGKEYLNHEIIDLFTQKQPENHRALGFDKPQQVEGSSFVPPSSAYGHLGFTGTAMWIDPENEIVFVFLSNRVHPYASNNLMSETGVRSRIYQTIYNALVK